MAHHALARASSKPPAGPFHVALVAVSSPTHYTLWNALAVESLAGDLRSTFGDAISVSISRIRSEDEREAVSQRITRENPAVLGISVECGGVETALQFAKRVASGPRAPRILFGGKIPSYFPELFLRHIPSATVVAGEGELPFRRIVERWLDRNEDPLSAIPNLAHCDASGEILRTRSERPCASELVHAPAIDTVPELLAGGAGTFLTQASRGCSWGKCTYCTVSSFRLDTRWEALPWKRTLRHIEDLVQLGVRELEFCDDEFMGGRDPEHVDRIDGIAEDLEQVGENCGGLAFRIFLIPHTVYRDTDPDGNRAVLKALQRLKRAGLVRVYFGVESGSEAQMKRYCRGTPVADVIGALDVVKGLGLGIDCGFIMFDPLATVDDIAANSQFFRRHELIRHNQWPFRPLISNEGSGFGRMMARRGILPDPDYMCYRYSFADGRVQMIFDTVDEISTKTRSLFYALKVISKTHFDPRKTTEEAERAHSVVIENGLIYLDLIDDLLISVRNPQSERSISAAMSRAGERVQDLVTIVARDVDGGVFRDMDGRLRSELAPHVAQFEITASLG